MPEQRTRYIDEERKCRLCGCTFVFKASAQVAIQSTGYFCGAECNIESKKRALYQSMKNNRKLRQMRAAGYL